MDTLWAVVGNVVRSRRKGPGGAETRPGTKHFSGGARVVVASDFPGMAETVVVVGRSRVGRYITVAIRVWLLTNLRPGVQYSPAIVERVLRAQAEYLTSPVVDEISAKKAIRKYRSWIEAERARRAQKGAHWWVAEE